MRCGEWVKVRLNKYTLFPGKKGRKHIADHKRYDRTAGKGSEIDGRPREKEQEDSSFSPVNSPLEDRKPKPPPG